VQNMAEGQAHCAQGLQTAGLCWPYLWLCYQKVDCYVCKQVPLRNGTSYTEGGLHETWVRVGIWVGVRDKPKVRSARI